MSKAKLLKAVILFLVKHGYKHRHLIAKGLKHVIAYVKAKELLKLKKSNKPTEVIVGESVSATETASQLSKEEKEKLTELELNYLAAFEKNRKELEKHNLYAHAGAMGVSPSSMEKLSKALDIISEHEKNTRK